MANYDSVLSEVLVKALIQMYHTESEDAAYRILLSRFVIDRLDKCKGKKITLWDWRAERVGFLTSELNLPIMDGRLYFGDIFVSLVRAKENSLANIMDDWHFQYADKLTSNRKGSRVHKQDLIDADLADIISAATKTIKAKKRSRAYYPLLKQECLIRLCRRYGVERPSAVGRIDGFVYGETHNDFALTLDEKYDRLAHAETLGNNKLSESELEKYLIQHLDLIEDGMSFVSNQYVIENGRLDILAKDKNGVHCIIELKVEDDPGIVFQVMYYRMAMEEKLQTKALRVIAIAPSFPPHFLKVLQTIEDLELFSFQASLAQDSIKSMTLQPIQNNS